MRTEICRANFTNQTAASDLGAIYQLVSQLKEARPDTDDVKAEAAGAAWVLSQDHSKNKVSFATNHGIAPIVQLLAMGNERAQMHAAHALASLGLDDEKNQGQIASLLVGVLGSGSLESKSRAANALWRLVQENPTSQQTIATAGTASELIALLKEGADDAQAYALWSLSLSIDENSQKTLLEEDGVQPLVAALKATKSKTATAPAEVTRQQAAAAISLLAHNNGKSQQVIAQAGGIEPLIQILLPDRADSIESREHAAAALSDLALLQPNRVTIVEGGGIDPIVLLLKEGASNGKRNAAAALARLATGSDEIATAIAHAGAIAPLVDLLSGAHGDGAQEEGADALFALAGNEGNRLAITEVGGIGPLVVLLGSTNSKARGHAEGALVRLSIESANRAIIIKKLVGMLHVEEGHSGDAGAQEQAAAALANLASDSAENRMSIVDAGGIEPLLTLLKNESRLAMENAVSAITQLAYKSDKIQRAIADVGGIPLISNVLVSASSNVKEMAAAAQLCSKAARAISQLAERNKENQDKISEAGAIQPLVAMLGSPNPEHQANAALALSELSAGNQANQAAIARTGAIAPLCTLVREGTEPEVREQSAAALWSLAADNSANKATVAKLGGIEPLVTLLVSGGSESSHANTIGALAALCSKHVENRETIAKLLVARMNSRMAMLQTPGGATRVLSAVSQLCQSNSANQIAMAKAGGVPPLIMWLSGGFDARSFSAEAQQEAAHALLSVVSNNEALQGLVTRSNGILPIIELVSKGTLETQEFAARTLWHLAGTAESGTAIAEAGGMPPLVSMLSADNVHAQELAAVVIARLLRSHESVSLIVADVGGIVPLVRLMKSGSTAAQQQAASALTEVGKAPENRNAIAEAGGIQPIVDLLTSTVVGTPESAARALANLARDHRVLGDDSGAPPDEDQEGATADEPAEKPGASRRRMILQAGGVQRLVQMLWSVPNKNMSKKTWELVASVIGADLTDGEAPSPPKEGHGDGNDEVLDTPEQAAATIADLVYGDEDMQDAVIDAKGVPPLLRLMRNSSSSTAARAVWHLCAANHNQGVIVECGAITDLVTLSKTGSARAQELAAAVISDLAKGAIVERELAMKAKEAAKAAEGTSGSPSKAGETESADGAGSAIEDVADDGSAKQADEGVAEDDKQEAGDGSEDSGPARPKDRLSAIADAGGIGPLVGLVTNGNAMGKERAASALWHLSVDAVNQVSVAKAGGIPPIVQLLDDGTPQATVFAADALSRLAHNNTENQTNIAKKLVSLLGYKNADAQRRAAHALWQLASKNQGAPVRVVNAGAISPLVMLLGTGSIEAKEEAAEALRSLAHNNPSNQLAIATGLVALLGTGTAEGQEQVTKMLIKFAEDPHNRTAISEAGAVQRLIGQLRGGGETSIKAQELAAAVLVHLCEDSQENLDALVEHEGIEPLVLLLQGENEEAQARAAAAICRITLNQTDIQTRVAAQGAIDPLVALLSHGKSVDARSEAASALWSLSTANTVTQQAIADAGAIPPLVRLLHENSDDQSKREAAQRQAARALATLAKDNATIQDSIASNEGIPPLVSLLGEDHEDEVHAMAAMALAELARNHEANQTAVAKAGGIEPFVRLLRAEQESERAKCEAASALWSFSTRHFANQVAIAKAGGVAPLVSLLGYGGTYAQEQAAGALASIALDNPDNEGAIAEMVVGLLDDRGDDLETSAKAARAISRLARSHPSNQVALAKAGGIPPLVGMLGDPSEAADGKRPSPARVLLQKEVASALWSMAVDNPENQAAIADQGGVPRLITLLSGSATIHRDAAGALWSLAAASSNQSLIATEGGIAPLVALLSDGSAGAQETAAGALHSLAELDTNRDRISEAGGVALLVALFEKGSADAKEQAAGALSAMVVKNPANQNEVAKGLVDVLISSNSLSAQQHVTKLLYHLSRDQENRGALSKWGAIPQLANQVRDGSQHGDVELVDNAANALAQIALKSPQHRVQVTAQLIALLGSPVLEVRQRAWSALKDMANVGGADSQMTVAMAGGIDRFVSLLKDGSVEAQEYALWLLWQSTDKQSKVSITGAECAKPIIAVLRSGTLSPVAEEHASAILSLVTCEAVPSVEAETWSKNKGDVVSAGGIPPLTRLLRAGSPGAKQHAALTLAQLTRNGSAESDSHIGPISAVQVDIAEAGAIAALVEWLTDPSLGQPSMAARALADIGMGNAATQSTIAESGAIPPLIKMVSDATDVEGAVNAASALATLAEENDANAASIAQKNGIAPLVELLRNHGSDTATRALWFLANSSENQLTILREGGVVPIVHMLSTDSERGQEWAAAALEALSRDCPENQIALSRAGAIPPLVVLLGSGSDTTQRYAQGALLNVAMPNNDNRNAVVKALVALLEVRNAAAQMKSAESLSILASRSMPNRSAIAAAGAIPPLVRLLGDGRNVNKAQIRAATALSDLARSGENKQAIMSAGGIEPLVQMLASSSSEAQARAAAALDHLSASTSAQSRIADAGGIELLVALLSSERIVAANHAACALYNLGSTKSNKEVMLKAGTIAPLVALLNRTDSAEVQDAGAALLADLARNQVATKNSIVKSGGIAPLVLLLQNGSATAQKHASCALWALTSEPQHQTAVARAGAVPHLVKLLSTNTEAQGYAAAALCNLVQDASARAAIQQAGGVEPLIHISHGPETWLRSQAVGILEVLKVEIPAALSGPPIRIAVHKPYYQTEQGRDAYLMSWTMGRGWDSAFNNPRLWTEENEHLTHAPGFSPRGRSPRSARALRDASTGADGTALGSPGRHDDVARVLDVDAGAGVERSADGIEAEQAAPLPLKGTVATDDGAVGLPAIPEDVESNADSVPCSTDRDGGGVVAKKSRKKSKGKASKSSRAAAKAPADTSSPTGEGPAPTQAGLSSERKQGGAGSVAAASARGKVKATPGRG